MLWDGALWHAVDALGRKYAACRPDPRIVLSQDAEHGTTYWPGAVPDAPSSGQWWYDGRCFAPLIQVAADKSAIVADGQDVATVTATIAEDGEVEFSADGGQTWHAVQTSGGKATFQVASMVPGPIWVAARHPKFGVQGVQIDAQA